MILKTISYILSNNHYKRQRRALYINTGLTISKSHSNYKDICRAPGKKKMLTVTEFKKLAQDLNIFFPNKTYLLANRDMKMDLTRNQVQEEN